MRVKNTCGVTSNFLCNLSLLPPPGSTYPGIPMNPINSNNVFTLAPGQEAIYDAYYSSALVQMFHEANIIPEGIYGVIGTIQNEGQTQTYATRTLQDVYNIVLPVVPYYVLNGGFESGTDDEWYIDESPSTSQVLIPGMPADQTYPTNTRISIVSDIVHGGAYSGDLHIFPEENNAWCSCLYYNYNIFMNTPPLTIGSRVEFSIWAGYKANVASGDAYIYPIAIELDSAGREIRYTPFDTGTSEGHSIVAYTSSWRNYVFEYTVRDSRCASLGFGFLLKVRNSGFNIHVDDLTIRPI